jgi:iron complex transport system ATP-binding protein
VLPTGNWSALQNNAKKVSSLPEKPPRAGAVTTTASADEVRAAREAASGLRMFFSIAYPAPGDGSWRPVRSLYGSVSGPLDDLIDTVVSRLGRVAVSLFFQGYAARLLSPQLGCLAVGGCVPAVPTGSLSFRRPGDELIELGLAGGPGWRGSAGALIDVIVTQSFAEHLRPLTQALLARTRLSSSLLRDNVASALVSALQLTDGKLGTDWRTMATRALDHPLLRDSGILDVGDPAFVRRSCCLYYRVENGSTCADCPLAR